MMRDYKTTIDSIMREGKRAIEEDNAECLILGCTGMIGQAGEAQKNLCVPVLDPVMCGIKVAEMRADLWRNYGISHSKRGGFEAPPKNELKNIFESYYGKNK
jgi:allantoin racemase